MWICGLVGTGPFGIDDAALYPLFGKEVIALMRETTHPDHQNHVATGVIVKARRPSGAVGHVYGR